MKERVRRNVILFLLHRNIHSYLVFKIFQNVFSKAENIVFFITMLAYFEKYGMINDKSSTLQCENVT